VGARATPAPPGYAYGCGRFLQTYLTVVVEAIKMNDAGAVLEVDESVAVGPALNDDATRLRVERKQCTVQMTRRLHHSAKPPPHSTTVMHVHAKQLEIALRVEAGRAETQVPIALVVQVAYSKGR